MDLPEIKQNTIDLLTELKESGDLKKHDLLVIGCSTSEVAGKSIGTSGSSQIAQVLFEAFKDLRSEFELELAFQGCEHLNRALVVERQTAEKYQLEIVAAIPVREAGGAMAAYAYEYLEDAVLVEFIQADFGIDIGDTLIGMHLKPVAVPLRFKQREIGRARITAAKTRPKLIGGKRAVYS